MKQKRSIPKRPGLPAMYAELADVYRKMADLLDRGGARMATREALERDALEVHATVLRAKIMEAEEPDDH